MDFRNMNTQNRLANFFINPSYKVNTTEYNQAKMLVNVCIITSFFSLSYMLISLFFTFEKGAYLMFIDLIGFITVAFLVRKKINLNFLSNLYIGIGAFAVYYLIVYSGGLYSPIMLWIVAAPILALLVANRGSAITWAVIMLFGIISFSFLEIYKIKPESEIPEEWNTIATLSVILGLMLIIFLITLIFEKEKTKAVEKAIAKNVQLKNTLKELTITKDNLQKSHEEIKNKNDQLVKHQIELLKNSELLKDLNSEKDYIIEVLAHDLKEPINSVDGLLDIILKDENKLSESQLECIDHIQKTIKKSRNLLDRILFSAEKEHLSTKMKFEKSDVCKVLQDSIDAFIKKAENKQIVLETQCNKKEIIVRTDRTILQQIFENIISNSIKFSPKESKVSISIELMEQNVKIDFQDQGPGIAKEEIDILFDKYTTLSNKPTAGESSSGLGLSLVKRYTELLGAKIWYESRGSEGANFILLLPREV